MPNTQNLSIRVETSRETVYLYITNLEILNLARGDLTRYQRKFTDALLQKVPGLAIVASDLDKRCKQQQLSLDFLMDRHVSRAGMLQVKDEVMRHAVEYWKKVKQECGLPVVGAVSR